MEQIALGRFNMSEAELNEISPRAFNNKLVGANQIEDFKTREAWEQHREVIVTLTRPHLKKQYAKKTMQELYPLPWDQQKKLPGKKKKNIDPVEFWADIDARTKK